MKHLSQAKKIFYFIKPFYPRILKSVILSFFLMLLMSPTPFFTKMLIDDAYPAQDFNMVILIIITIIAFKLFSGLSAIFHSLFTSATSVNMGVESNRQFLKRIFSHDINFFSKYQAGDILSRFGDMGTSIDGLVTFVNTIINNTLSLLIYPAILFMINTKLALLSLCFLPLEIVIMYFSGRIMKKIQKETYENAASQSSAQFESLKHIESIKTFNKEDYFYEKVNQHYSHGIQLSYKSVVYGQGFSFSNSLIAITSNAIMLFFAWNMIFTGELTLGGYVAFTSYLGMATAPITSFVGLIENWQRLSVSFERFLEVYEHKKANLFGKQNIENLKKIELKNNLIVFNQNKILEDVNILFEAGNSYLVKGKSGDGKSSLLKMLSGMSEASSINGIYYNDINILNFSPKSIRSTVLYLTATPFLFKGTVAENIFFDQPVDEQIFITALKMCNIFDSYQAGLFTLDTIIDELGGTLSSGQKQRLALTRLFVNEYDVVILDEATSGLDQETEFSTIQNVIKAYKNKISIVVSHRQHLDTLFDSTINIQNKQAYQENVNVFSYQ